MDVAWLDVQMWTPLRGHMHPFTDIECDVPEPLPEVPLVWGRWALDHLAAVAVHDGWQPGRYHYTAEGRDRGGHAVEVFARGYWEWTP